MQPTRLDTRHAITLDDIVKRTTDLPTLPAATLAVMREAENPNGSAATVTRFLSQDQSLVVRVLRLANSSYYGLGRRISDVQEAVVVLGMRSVKNLAMVASTYPWMNKPLRGYELAPSMMWQHSFGVGVAAQLVAKRTGKASPEQAFTAGLLHDMGKVAMSVWLENKVATMAKISEQGGMTFDMVERKVLGYDHQDVGAHLAKSWNLPEELIECMQYHHHPDDCQPTSALVDCVHIGDFLAMSMGLGLGGDGMCYSASADALVRLGIPESDIPQLADDFMVSYEQHEKLFEALTA